MRGALALTALGLLLLDVEPLASWLLFSLASPLALVAGGHHLRRSLGGASSPDRGPGEPSIGEGPFAS